MEFGRIFESVFFPGFNRIVEFLRPDSLLKVLSKQIKDPESPNKQYDNRSFFIRLLDLYDVYSGMGFICPSFFYVFL